jgi:hypothetical protein
MPQHLPKRLDGGSLVAAMARYETQFSQASRWLLYHLDAPDALVLDDHWQVRLGSRLADFSGLTPLGSQDPQTWLRSLSRRGDCVMAFAGMSLPQRRAGWPRSQELGWLRHLCEDGFERRELQASTLKMREQLRHGPELVVQDGVGHFSTLRGEKQFLRAIRRESKAAEARHFSSFSLVWQADPPTGTGERLIHQSYQFCPRPLLDLDLLASCARQIEQLCNQHLGSSGAEPLGLWLEGDMVEILEWLLAYMNQHQSRAIHAVSLPPTVFGYHPLVSFAEFLAWSHAPRLMISLDFTLGLLQVCMINQAADS